MPEPQMTEEERGKYILNWTRAGLTVEQQIREVLPLVAGELGNDYRAEGHIRASRYVADVRWLLGEIDRLRARSERETYANRHRVLDSIVKACEEQAPEIAEKRPDVLEFVGAVRALASTLQVEAIARSTEHLCEERFLSIAALCVAALERIPEHATSRQVAARPPDGGRASNS